MQSIFNSNRTIHVETSNLNKQIFVMLTLHNIYIIYCSNTAFVPYIIGQLFGRYDDVNDRTSGTLVTTGDSITGYPQSAGAAIISGTPMENISTYIPVF